MWKKAHCCEGLTKKQRKLLEKNCKVGLSDRENHILVTSQVDKNGWLWPVPGHETRGSLLDEPTSALDPELVGEVEIHWPMQQNQDKPCWSAMICLFVAQVADKVLFLDKGRIIESEITRRGETCNIQKKNGQKNSRVTNGPMFDIIEE